jgi:hypothetical protein
MLKTICVFDAQGFHVLGYDVRGFRGLSSVNKPFGFLMLKTISVFDAPGFRMLGYDT